MKIRVYGLILITMLCFVGNSQAAHLIDLNFSLSPDQTDPPATFPNGTTLPSGFAMVQVNTTDNTISWEIDYQDLTGQLTAAHFHGPAALGSNASPQISITSGAQSATGTLSGSASITDTQKTDVLSGLWYLNFHAAANPAGELRGQVVNIPEPSSAILLIGGMLALVTRSRRQR